jgi:hypothetical protein
MSTPLKEPGGSGPRASISIPRRDGAHVFANEGGGLTVEQDPQVGDGGLVAFEAEEAMAVAAALMEVAEAVIRQRQTGTEGQHGAS